MTERTDVEHIDGVAYCNSCNHFVSADNTCGPECQQTELAKVLSYIADRIGDGEGRVYDDLRELHAELMGGAHR